MELMDQKIRNNNCFVLQASCDKSIYLFRDD